MISACRIFSSHKSDVRPRCHGEGAEGGVEGGLHRNRDPCGTIPQRPALCDPRDDGLPMSAVDQKLRTAAVIIFRGWGELARLNLHLPGRQSPLSERKGEW